MANHTSSCLEISFVLEMFVRRNRVCINSQESCRRMSTKWPRIRVEGSRKDRERTKPASFELVSTDSLVSLDFCLPHAPQRSPSGTYRSPVPEMRGYRTLREILVKQISSDDPRFNSRRIRRCPRSPKFNFCEVFSSGIRDGSENRGKTEAWMEIPK